MPKAIDITGQRFGRLVVLGVERSGKGGLLWRCRCDCGQERLNVSYALRTGRIQSCGCRIAERAAEMGHTKRLPPGTVPFNQAISRYRQNARRRRIRWGLPEFYAKQLMLLDCFYCGAKPAERLISTHRPWWGALKINGIDRLNSRDHYTPDNCVPCCSRCNYAKGQMSSREFLAWIRRVFHHTEKTNAKKAA